MTYPLDHERITYARELKGFLKKDLAEKVGKSPSALTQIEKGIIRPDPETLKRISLALSVPTSFFIKKEGNRFFKLDNCHFRSKRTVSQLKRKQSVRIGDFLIEVIDLLEKRGIVLPKEKISDFNAQPTGAEDIETVAIALRKFWGMGLGPIPNFIKLLESKGIIVIPIYESCEEVDAFSIWEGRRPCVMLALGKTASRGRFDAAHELGHLVLHEEHAPGSTFTENQADRFAGAFLAPRDSFILECPRRWNYESFAILKKRWKLSIQALVYRAYNLGVFSESSMRRAFIDLTQRGLRRDEGVEWPKEQPTLFNQAIELLEHKITLNEMASELCVFKSDLITYLGKSVSLDLLKRLDRRTDEANGKIVFLRDS